MSLQEDNFKSLRSLADLLDTKYKGPFGIRIGLDGLLGFIPVVGDFITSAMSIYIIIQAAAFGCGPATLARMALNVMIENLFDSVPLLGNFFDIFWKANAKNMLLLERFQSNPQAVRRSSRIVLGLLCFALIAVLAGVAALSIKLLAYLISLVG